MAALVGVIAHRCWDQIVGDYGHQPAMSRQLGSIPPRTSQPGRVGRPGMMLSDAILQTPEGSECRRPSSPACKPLGCARRSASRPAGGPPLIPDSVVVPPSPHVCALGV